MEDVEVWTPTEEEWKAYKAELLSRLGCTLDDLRVMHESGDYETADHRNAWIVLDAGFRNSL